VITHQLQVERRTGKVHRPETDVLPLSHTTNGRRRAWVQIASATLSGNSLRQTVHTIVPQAAKLVAALLRVAGVTAGLAESNDSLPPGL